MTEAERIAALRRELADMQDAAVEMFLPLVAALAPTPLRREEMARTFENEADKARPQAAALARRMAEAIRRGAG